MPVGRGADLPSERGRRDAMHHRDRVRKQVLDHLKNKIGGEDIIQAGPSKRIRVPVKGEKRYRFILDRGDQGGVGQGDFSDGDVIGPPAGPGDKPGQEGAGAGPGETMYEVWLDMAEVEELLFAELELPRLKPKVAVDASATDIKFNDRARKGPTLDVKASLKENLLRNAAQGTPGLGGWEKEDLRYRSYRELPQPKSQAVVFMLMDVSASMGDKHKRIARLFFYWTASFLRSRYDNVKIVFISHHTEANECSEQEFFGRTATGGTCASSAYKLARQIQASRFPASDWNVYVLHASDGDNFASDNPDLIREASALARACQMMGYLEIAREPGNHPFAQIIPRLWKVFSDHEDELPGHVAARANDDREIWPALKKIFAAENVEEAVRP